MNFGTRMLLTKFGLFAGFLVSVQVQLNAQTLDIHPIFEMGDKWTYRYQNKGDRKDPYLYTSQAYLTKNGNAWLYVESQNPDANHKQAVQRYDYKRADVMEQFAFNPKKRSLRGKRFSNRQPMDDWIQLPMVIGKKYDIKEDWTNGEGNNKYDVEIEAFEKIKVEAGEFETYRIKYSGWWTRTGNGSGSGRVDSTLWYSPIVKRIVKRNYIDRTPQGSTWNENTTELVKWEPRAELPAAVSEPLLTSSAPAAEEE